MLLNEEYSIEKRSWTPRLLFSLEKMIEIWNGWTFGGIQTKRFQTRQKYICTNLSISNRNRESLECNRTRHFSWNSPNQYNPVIKHRYSFSHFRGEWWTTIHHFTTNIFALICRYWTEVRKDQNILRLGISPSSSSFKFGVSCSSFEYYKSGLSESIQKSACLTFLHFLANEQNPMSLIIFLSKVFH